MLSFHFHINNIKKTPLFKRGVFIFIKSKANCLEQPRIKEGARKEHQSVTEVITHEHLRQDRLHADADAKQNGNAKHDAQNTLPPNAVHRELHELVLKQRACRKAENSTCKLDGVCRNGRKEDKRNAHSRRLCALLTA